MTANLIKARDANIYWRYSHTNRVYDVRVRDRFDLCEERVTSSGAYWTGWKHARGTNPETLFGEMLIRYGFTTMEEARIALLQFAKIDNCQWARNMLDAKMYGRVA
ncbi:MAG: hypothetical protein PHX43_01520 [Alphaproteobacteria bacterium]|nr:hypothetical protein [Alphaproteobacteria bacterium]